MLSHSTPTRTQQKFHILGGEAIAQNDAEQVRLKAGDILVIEPGSEHRIANISTANRFYAITIMANDEGFAKLVSDGTTVPPELDDIAALIGARKPV